MSENKEQTNSREDTGAAQPCCDEGSCCPSESGAGGKGWKIVVFVLIVVAAGAVLAHSLLNKSSSVCCPGGECFVTAPAEEVVDVPLGPDVPDVEETVTEPESGMGAGAAVDVEEVVEVPDKPVSILPLKPLDSLNSLNRAAADLNVVFILLGADNPEDNEPIAKKIESAAMMVQADGSKVAAFVLNKDTPNYARFAKQFSTPCVLATVKGGGMSVVSDDITEARLIQAYVLASRPRSGCGPGGCAPGSPCGPKPAGPGGK
jgi:hypothetical protein